MTSNLIDFCISAGLKHPQATIAMTAKRTEPTNGILVTEGRTTIPIAIPIDYSIVAASELGNISDRRTYLLLKGNDKVPKLLLKETGINSGFMILQYTSAALVSENKNLCFPASADSITTSLGQEDHVSMGSIGAVKFLKVIKNLEKILAIELLCSAQAFDFLKPLSSSNKVNAFHKYIRQKIDFCVKDKIFIDDIKHAINIIKSKKLVELTS